MKDYKKILISRPKEEMKLRTGQVFSSMIKSLNQEIKKKAELHKKSIENNKNKQND